MPLDLDRLEALATEALAHEPEDWDAPDYGSVWGGQEWRIDCVGDWLAPYLAALHPRVVLELVRMARMAKKEGLA